MILKYTIPKTVEDTIVLSENERIYYAVPYDIDQELGLVKGSYLVVTTKRVIVLREGEIAYGLDENLVRYRRPGKSLSSNKLEALRRIWNLYRKAEGLGVFRSAYYFCFWAFRAVRRRL